MLCLSDVVADRAGRGDIDLRRCLQVESYDVRYLRLVDQTTEVEREWNDVLRWQRLPVVQHEWLECIVGVAEQ